MEDFYLPPDEKLKTRKFAEYRARFIEPFFPKDTEARIADLGCGYGLFLDACRRSGYEHSEGVESVPAFARYAEQEFGVRVAQKDIFDYLDLKSDGSLDVITAFNVIEHVKKDRVPDLLRLIRAKLSSDGIFIMEVPNADSPLGVHTYFSDLTHEFAYSKKLAVRLLKAAGFERIAVAYEPNLRNPLIKLTQQILAKMYGLDSGALFSGNIVLIGYAR